MFINDYKGVVGGRDYKYFTAFESTEAFGHVDPNGARDADVYHAWRGITSDGSWWWYQIPVYQQTYTEYVFVPSARIEEPKEEKEPEPVLPDTEEPKDPGSQVAEPEDPELVDEYEEDPEDEFIEDDIEDLIEAVEETTLKLSIKKGKTKSGKTALKISWTKDGEDVDYYQVYRSTKKSSGYKLYYTTKSGNAKSYTNSKGFTKGKTYYYKIRGVRVLDGKKVYTKTSNKVYKKITRK